MRHFIMAAGLALMLAVTGAGQGCQTSPATGRTQLNVLPESDAVAIGEEAAPQFLEEYGGPIPSDQIQDYVDGIGQRLAEVSERPHLPWEFHAVDSAMINAFALPGGKVFVTRGLLSEMGNEAQLAGVLGHEIGHVTDQHVGRRMTRQRGAQLGLTLFGATVGVDDPLWMDVLGIGTGAYLLSYDRDEEVTADELGVRYMASAGYNPVAAVQFLEILERHAGEQPALLELFQTHPNPGRRIENLNRLIREQYPDYQEPGAYEFGQDRYEREVLAELEELPPPEHGPGG